MIKKATIITGSATQTTFFPKEVFCHFSYSFPGNGVAATIAITKVSK